MFALARPPQPPSKKSGSAPLLSASCRIGEGLPPSVQLPRLHYKAPHLFQSAGWRGQPCCGHSGHVRRTRQETEGDSLGWKEKQRRPGPTRHQLGVMGSVVPSSWQWVALLSRPHPQGEGGSSHATGHLDTRGSLAKRPCLDIGQDPREIISKGVHQAPVVINQ